MEDWGACAPATSHYTPNDPANLKIRAACEAKKPVEAAEALAHTLRAHQRTFSLITNVLAKDKEIGDRWRGFRDVADSTICPTGWSARSWIRWSRRCRRPIRACPTAITS
jgi:hypothetical protein